MLLIAKCLEIKGLSSLATTIKYVSATQSANEYKKGLLTSFMLSTAYPPAPSPPLPSEVSRGNEHWSFPIALLNI